MELQFSDHNSIPNLMIYARFWQLSVVWFSCELLARVMTVSVDKPNGGDLVWLLDDVERQQLRARFVRSIGARDNASGPPVQGSRLVVEVVVPSHGLRNDTYATCEFAERDGVRRLVSIQFQASADRTLLKADLALFPLAEVEDELDRLLQNRRARYGSDQVVDVLGEIGNLPRPRHAPTRKNSNWPKLLHVAVLYSELCSHPATKSRAHEFFADREERNKISHAWSSQISASNRQASAQLVKKARDAGFLKPTAARSRGGELTGLARYLQRNGFVDGNHKEAYDPKRWGLAIDAYYGESMPPERREELTEWFAAFMPAKHAQEAAQAVAEGRIIQWLEQQKEARKENS